LYDKYYSGTNIELALYHFFNWRSRNVQTILLVSCYRIEWSLYCIEMFNSV